MSQQIFLNLPVKDLQRSVRFFTALGYTFDPKFTDQNASCMIVGENIFVMLLVESFFQTFTHKSVADGHKVAEAIVALNVDSRQAVDDMVSKAIAVGATAPRPPDDHGFMYLHGFQDPDGHIWEYFHMTSPPPR